LVKLRRRFVVLVLILASRIDGTIASGFFGFGGLAFLGLRLLIRGARGDIYDWLGERWAPRWSYIAAGLLCLVPLVGFIAFLIHQGWFQRFF
jgi:hypothetical protein